MTGPLLERWLVLEVELPPPGQELPVADALRRLGARAVEREDTHLVAWLPPPGQVDDFLAGARAALATASALVEPGLRWRWEPYETWAARRARDTPAVRITHRLAVIPEGASPPDGAEIVVRLAPGAAFGTAEHPTTRACLELLEGRVRAGDRVLDVGSGSGVLAIAAALLGADEVLALEADPVACDEALRNVRLNAVSDRVRVVRRRATPSTPPRQRAYDGVLANLEGSLLLPLLPGLAAAMAPGGWLIASGLVAPERAAACDILHREGCHLAAERRSGGWWSGLFSRPAAPGP